LRALCNKECSQFLEEIEKSVSNRVGEEKSPHEAYLDLYKKVKTFDKYIARRYDDLRGSRYFTVLMGLILDEVLTQEDLSRFDEEMREKLLNSAKLWGDDSE